MPLTLSALADKSSARYKGRARLSEIADIPGMEGEGWRNRLRLAVDASKKSQRAISIAAGLGPGYVNSLFKEGKDPTIENLMKVCEVVGASLSYVLYGVEMSRQTEETLRLLQEAPEDEREAWLALLKKRRRPVD